MDTFMTEVRTKPARNDCTAEVFINGLALLCFSRKFNRAEAGFLSTKEEHPLLFTIYDKDCVPIPSTDEFPNPVELHSGTTIKINSEPPPPADLPDPLEIRGEGALYCPTPGNEPSSRDDLDFRHVINLDKLHTHPSFGTPAHPRIEVNPNSYFAKLYLKKGVFFAAELSTQYSKIYNMGHVIQRARVAKIVGAGIVNDSVKIDISSLNETKTLTKDAKHPYSIDIRFKCEQDPAVLTDFERFYEVLKKPLPAGHRKTTMIYEDVELPSGTGCPAELFESLQNEDKISFKKRVEENPAILKLLNNFKKAAEACEASTKPKCPENLQGTTEPCPPPG